MPFARPSPAEIRDRMGAEIAVALPGADARLRRSMEEVLVRAIAIASHELHSHIEWAALQILPDTAEDEVLARHAAIWGITRITATAALGSVTFTGTPGAVVPANTELRRGDDARFLLAADVTIAGGGSGTGNVAARVAGAAGNSQAGISLALVAPVAGIAPSATVAAGGLAAGADAESDAGLRARLLQRIQSPPAGGASNDYVTWALAVAGVERVWVYPNWLGAGTVGVAFVTTGGAIPAAPLVAAVQAALDARRPVTAAVTAFAPATQAVALTIDLAVDTAAIRAAVLAELADFFVREAEPGGTIRVSRISAAISGALGEVAHLLVAPAADITLPAGTIATLGAVTWA
ncbi:MAG: baseplate J/gp47 family protein [Roseomonas sp.]|nr:baseplate J/gp47 family protein [Roseomonas sp.]